jgi:hypothetical protein
MFPNNTFENFLQFKNEKKLTNINNEYKLIFKKKYIESKNKSSNLFDMKWDDLRIIIRNETCVELNIIPLEFRK